MSHYVISDLHGERERFHKLLKIIDFTPEDTLHILGDIVDRGPDPIGLLREILAAPNMRLLLGNHEYMCLQCHGSEVTEIDWRRWNRNNNRPTLAGLAALTEQERETLFAQLRALPTHEILNIEDKTYYLVHGFPADTVHDEVWNRPQPDTPAPIPGVRVIIGHTPVSYLIGGDDAGEARRLSELNDAGEHLKIYHAPGFTDIDCGCGYSFPVRRLACLRLEDMAEFYA